MARVYLAHDSELGRLVALKVLDEHLAGDENFRARFAREARLAAGLSHPNVVTVFDVGEAAGRPFLVMEYVEGRTLEERLRDDGPLRPAEVEAVARQVCAGLEHAHAHGLVHRDLKPGNLIERTDGVVKIADFGIARAAEGTELTEAGSVVGTAAYLAPEQAEAGEVGPRADVFALGVVLYELVTGRRPWQIESLGDLGRRRDVPPAPLPAVPTPLATAVERSLAIDPAERPESAAAVAALLDAPDENATVVLAPRARPSRERRSGVPAVWLAALVGALLLALAALGVFLATTGGESDRSGPTPAPTVAVDGPADGATPAEDARNLSQWLRENAR